MVHFFVQFDFYRYLLGLLTVSGGMLSLETQQVAGLGRFCVSR